MSAAAIAAGALMSACGGGGGGGAEPDTSESMALASSNGAVPSSSETSSSASQLGATSTATATTATSSAPDGAANTVVASASPTAGLGASETGSTTATETTTVATAAQAVGVPTSTASGAVGKRSSVALNLGELTYYSPEIPTIDAMKRAGAWLTQCSTTCGAMTAGASAWDTLEESALDLDANGWIKSLPASGDATHKYRSATTVLSANGALPLGRYIVRYDGAGTITYSGFTKSTTSTAGRDVIDLTTSGNAWMTITATNPSNYLRNIRIYMPGGACANDLSVYAATADACNATTGTYVAFESFPATQIWHPLFLQDVKGFRALRFMDWNLTNATQVTSWSQRTLPTARTWTAATGAPVEAILDLANYIGADAWMNVPPHADDNYAAQMGMLAASHLTNGTSKLDLEYANEPWNFAFPATNWMLAQAKAKWPALVASGVSVNTLEDNWYGERLAQVCHAAKANAAPVRCVLNGWSANSWVTNQMLTCPYAAAELGHPCVKDVDVVAIAPYFGYYLSAAKLRATVSTWYADADGGLGKLFSELTGKDANGAAITPPLAAAGSGAPNGAIAQAQTSMVAGKAVADSFGLPLWAYEGGQHLYLPTGDPDKAILALFIAANRDPRMGAAYDRMMSDWKSAGGQTFAYYSHLAKPGAAGMWGLKEAMSDSTSPKWVSAVKNRNDKSCNWSGC